MNKEFKNSCKDLCTVLEKLLGWLRSDGNTIAQPVVKRRSWPCIQS